MNTLKTFDHVHDLKHHEAKLLAKHEKELQDFESERRAYYIKMIYSFLPILKDDEVIIKTEMFFSKSLTGKHVELTFRKNQKSIKLNELYIHQSVGYIELKNYPFKADQLALLLNHLEIELKDKTY